MVRLPIAAEIPSDMTTVVPIPQSYTAAQAQTGTSPAVHAQAQTVKSILPEPALSRLVDDMKELKLYLLQGKGAPPRNQNFGPRRPTPPYVTCHECGQKGHLSYDCPNLKHPGPLGDTKGKSAEVSLLECTIPEILDLEREVMVTKRDRSSAGIDMQPELRVPQAIGRPRKKPHKEVIFKSHKENITRTRRKIGISDLMLSHGQQEYSLAAVLGRQNANITVGQLIAKCPSFEENCVPVYLLEKEKKSRRSRLTEPKR